MLQLIVVYVICVSEYQLKHSSLYTATDSSIVAVIAGSFVAAAAVAFTIAVVCYCVKKHKQKTGIHQ